MPAPERASSIEIPATAGQYLLFLEVEEPVQMAIGRLGIYRFEPRSYIYVGSARGPGGLSGRVSRHLRAFDEKRCYWHIDYLSRTARIVAVGWSAEPQLSECDWSAALGVLGRRWPARFGASDCRCAGHLIKIQDRTNIQTVLNQMPEQLHFEPFESITC